MNLTSYLSKNRIMVVDLISATLVLVALFSVKENPNYWLLYAAGCAVYVIINYHRNLYGQSIMNIIAVVLAIKNLL